MAAFVAALYLGFAALLLFVSPVCHPESEWESEAGVGVDEHL